MSFFKSYLQKQRSITILGDSHQRYLYCGLIDLIHRNCSTTYLNPKYLSTKHLNKQAIENWFPSTPSKPIHIVTGNYGFSQYNTSPSHVAGVAPSFNQTLYQKILELSKCMTCLAVMNVGIHDMTTHTLHEYNSQHSTSNMSNNEVYNILEKLFEKNVKQFLSKIFFFF